MLAQYFFEKLVKRKNKEFVNVVGAYVHERGKKHRNHERRRDLRKRKSKARDK
jgi:hypothetical protein